MDTNLSNVMVGHIKKVMQVLEGVTCLRFTPLEERRALSRSAKVLYIRRGRRCLYGKVDG